MTHTPKTKKKRLKTQNLTEKPSKLISISPEVLEIGKKNGLKLREVNFVDKLFKNHLNASEAYRQAINPNTTPNTTYVEASKKLRKPKVSQTIEEILSGIEITENESLKFHKKIRDKSLQNKDFTNARETNRDFLKILRILDKEPQENAKTSVYIWGNYITPKEAKKSEKTIKTSQK